VTYLVALLLDHSYLLADNLANLMAKLSAFMIRRNAMPKVVSSSEAQNNFGAMLQWAEEQGEEIVVERRGKPAAVIISHAEYEEIQRLRLAERKRLALAAIRQLREEVRAANQDLSAEEAYQMAGFSEEVVQETLAADEELKALSL
jgi:prevent-host-death family protein